jgi:hypothetical protein
MCIIHYGLHLASQEKLCSQKIKSSELASSLTWQQNLLPEGQVYDTCPAGIPNLKQQIQQCIEAIPNYFPQCVCQAECKRTEVVTVAKEIT